MRVTVVGVGEQALAEDDERDVAYLIVELCEVTVVSVELVFEWLEVVAVERGFRLLRCWLNQPVKPPSPPLPMRAATSATRLSADNI